MTEIKNNLGYYQVFTGILHSKFKIYFLGMVNKTALNITVQMHVHINFMILNIAISYKTINCTLYNTQYQYIPLLIAHF